MPEVSPEPFPDASAAAIAAGRARAYFAEVRSRDLGALPPIIRERVTAELLRHGEALLAAFDDMPWLPPAPPESERARLEGALLAAVPESQRGDAAHRHHDAATAVARVLAAIPGDTAAIVTGWLRAAALTPAQLATALAALGDGISFRSADLGRQCADCRTHPAGLCDDCAANLDAVERYQAVERQLIDKGAGQ